MSRSATTHISLPVGKTTTAFGQQLWLHSATRGDVATPIGVRSGWESANEFKARVFRAFDALAQRGEDCVVVCHGGVIANLLARAFPAEGRNFYEWQSGYGRGYALSIADGAAQSFEGIPT